MGTRFAEPVILNLHATWEESDTRTPLICFLSMGSDPTDQIEALAKNLELGKTPCWKFLFHVFIYLNRKKELMSRIPIASLCPQTAERYQWDKDKRCMQGNCSRHQWRRWVTLDGGGMFFSSWVADDVWAVTAGRLGPSAKLPSGSGVHGRTAWHCYNRRSPAWYLQGVDHHRATRSLLHHTATGNTAVTAWRFQTRVLF